MANMYAHCITGWCRLEIFLSLLIYTYTMTRQMKTQRATSRNVGMNGDSPMLGLAIFNVPIETDTWYSESMVLASIVEA